MGMSASCQVTDINCFLQDGVGNGSLPGVLAQICNDLWLLPMVCQGFIYDNFTGVASFLGQDQNQLIDLSHQPKTCNRPGSSMWLLNASKPAICYDCYNAHEHAG